VLAATVYLLQSVGYEQLTVADVAARAGVAESTVYRNWRSKPELVADAMLVFAEEEIPTPDTGSFPEDLQILLREIIALVTRPAVTRVVRAMAALEGDVPGQVPAQASFWGSRSARFGETFLRARKRGEIGPDVDPYEIGELLMGPLYLRLLLTGRPLDEEFVERSVRRALRACGYPGEY
jgi:AcrR family transcriptional regulator